MTPIRLDRETLIPLGVVVMVVMSISGGVVWMNSTLQSIDYRLQRLEEGVIAANRDRWKKHDMAFWAQLLQNRNPSLDVPEVFKP